MATQTQAKELTYEGSVKRVWQPADKDGLLWFEFTDDYSVFDWGKMPDVIANKGRALTTIGAFFFEKLSDPEFWSRLTFAPVLSRFHEQWLQKRFKHEVFALLSRHGAHSHFQRLAAADGRTLTPREAATAEEAVYMEVLKANVSRPEPAVLLGQTVFSYPPVPSPSSSQKDLALRLIPLEVVFRFGMPAGSSLKNRLKKDPSYLRLLALEEMPADETWFPYPVLEFFTKLEPKDRLLSVQEALLISGLSAWQFERLTELAYDLALALYVLFAGKGIELWDGKFEFVARGDKILLADSIGPDELRLIYKGCQLSKEMIRQIYRGSKWEQSLKESQLLAAARQSHDWKSICKNELMSFPEPLSPRFKTVIDHLYGALANHLLGEDYFAGEPTLDEFVQSYPVREDK